MAINMTLTLNTPPAKESGKEAPRLVDVNEAPRPVMVDEVSAVQPAQKVESSEPVTPVSTQLPEDDLEGAISQISDITQMLTRELEFDIDDDLGRTVVRVLDRESGDVIRQIPAEELLHVAKRMREYAELRDVDRIRPETGGSKEEAVGLLVKMQA